MKTRDFSFDLPERLIAQFPADRRENSRLLVLGRESGAVSHHEMTELPRLLPPNALVVLNDSRVRKARLYATTESGATREMLFLGRHAPEGEAVGAGATRPPITDGRADNGELWSVMTKRASRLREGSSLGLPGGLSATVAGHTSHGVILSFGAPLPESYFETHGHVPLPPYIKRDDRKFDADRYQTVYAAAPGSVAAPTAGLHLTTDLLEEIRRCGIAIEQVTLHVGPGTFLPVRTAEIDDHEMHSEQYEISVSTAVAISTALAAGRPVVAVGTTSVRTLESAWDPRTSSVVAGSASTDIFLKPGSDFNVVSGMLTNFHTPESTLLMLVSAFASREHVIGAYREAIDLEYRFFSYGDGMLILPG